MPAALLAPPYLHRDPAKPLQPYIESARRVRYSDSYSLLIREFGNGNSVSIAGTLWKVFTSAQAMAGTSLVGRIPSILVRAAAVPVAAEEDPTGVLPQILIVCTCLQIALLFLVIHRHNCATCPKRNAATKLQAGAASQVARL